MYGICRQVWENGFTHGFKNGCEAMTVAVQKQQTMVDKYVYPNVCVCVYIYIYICACELKRYRHVDSSYILASEFSIWVTKHITYQPWSFLVHGHHPPLPVGGLRNHSLERWDGK